MKIILWVFLSILVLTVTGCKQQKPDVILVIIDALRADHLGCYGYDRNTSPTIDSLAGSGIRWTRVQSQAPWTLPANASILSGLTVRSHGVYQNLNGRFPLSEDMPTIATILKAAGYFTVGIANCFWIGPELGFDIGFDKFLYSEQGYRNAEESVNSLITELESNDSDQPYFAMLHLYDVHAPYDPPPYYWRLWALNNSTQRPYWDVDQATKTLHDPENRQNYINLYDGEIRFVNDQLDSLSNWLRETGRAGNTIIVITSDHGEEFLDHGWIEHSVTLYQELLNIPLIITGAGIPAGIEETDLAGQIDILPTILSLLSVPIPEHLEGIALIPLSPQTNRVLPSSGTTVDIWNSSGRRNRNWVAVRSENKKLIWFADEDSSVYYDLELDPLELNPLPADSFLLEKALDYWATPPVFRPSSALNINEETTEMLEDLGYF